MAGPDQSERRRALTPVQCRALATISRRGPSTTTELADEFGMRSKGSLTRTLRTLVAEDLLSAEKLGEGWYADRRYSLTARANRLGYRARS